MKFFERFRSKPQISQPIPGVPFNVGDRVRDIYRTGYTVTEIDPDAENGSGIIRAKRDDGVVQLHANPAAHADDHSLAVHRFCSPLEMFDQVFAPADVVIVLILVLMEGILSVDNALVLGMLARRLPKSQQSRALTWGLIGAFVFRLAAIAFIGQLLQWHWAKLLGGLYLLYVALKYFVVEAREKSEESIVESPEGGPTLVDANTGKPLSLESELAELEARTVVPIPDADETDVTGPVGKKYPNFWLTFL